MDRAFTDQAGSRLWEFLYKRVKLNIRRELGGYKGNLHSGEKKSVYDVCVKMIYSQLYTQTLLNITIRYYHKQNIIMNLIS